MGDTGDNAGEAEDEDEEYFDAEESKWGFNMNQGHPKVLIVLFQYKHNIKTIRTSRTLIRTGIPIQARL